MARIADAALPEGTTGLMDNVMHRVLANNRAMADNFYLLANSIHHDSSLPARVRELAILRVTAVAGSDFEFSHHFVGCQTAGISADEARAVRDGRLSGFADAERTAIMLAEAVDANVVPDALWQFAAKHFSARQLLDLAMTASFYGFASRLCNGLGVPADPGFPTIAEA
jgi:alkylhydroperoxidase family enzyme